MIKSNTNDEISDLVAAIERSSSTYINQQNWFEGNFYWHEGMERFPAADHK